MRRIVAKPKVITKIRTRTMIRKVPVTKTRTIVRKVPVARTVVKRVPVTKTVVKTVRVPLARPGNEKALKELQSSISYMASEISSGMQELKKAVHEASAQRAIHAGGGASDASMSDECIALELITVFYKEVHRLGLKRRLELGDVVDAYFDALAKVRVRKLQAQNAPAAPQHQ